MSQLDGLRAIAVLLVLYTHFLPESYWFLGKYWGGYGVRLFFVLSGFLITGILLRCRARVESDASLRFPSLRVFYARRFLRIFPVYYVALGILYALGEPSIRDGLGWHVAYLSNVLFAKLGNWHGNDAHLWSLSVEEQFYVVWPWLVLFVPRRRLSAVLGALIVAAPLFRLGAALSGVNRIAIWVLTPSLLDCLGIGALLAVFAVDPDVREERLRARMRTFAGAGAVLVVFVEYLERRHGEGAAQVLDYSASALLFSWVVYGAARGFRSWVGRALSSPLAVYIGGISYGIYLLHTFVRDAVSAMWARTGFEPGLIAHALVASAVTIALAALSWHLLEGPLNGLKRHFPYPYERRAASARTGTGRVDR